MKASSKVVLFSRVQVGREVRQHPVAVFSRESDAKAYAVLINTAHKSGNAEFAKSLDVHTEVNDEGALIPGVKFSAVTVPYAPTAGAGDEDVFAD